MGEEGNVKVQENNLLKLRKNQGVWERPARRMERGQDKENQNQRRESRRGWTGTRVKRGGSTTKFRQKGQGSKGLLRTSLGLGGGKKGKRSDDKIC